MCTCELLVCTPSPEPPPTSSFCRGEEGGEVEPQNQIYQKGGWGLDKTLIFREVDGKEGGCNFYIKNKLKYETFNDKKSL